MAKRFRVTMTIDMETDDDETMNTEDFESYLTDTMEQGFLDNDTGITYYMSNGSIDVEPLPG